MFSTIRLITLFVLSCLIGANPAAAAGKVAHYEFEGVVFSAEEHARFVAAMAQSERGVAALGRNEWDTAVRECSAALATYRDIYLPEQGEGNAIYELARSCTADGYAAQDNWARACPLYVKTDYVGLVVVNAKRMCEQFRRDTDSAEDAHTRYAETFATFADHLANLIAAPDGSSERASKATILADDCTALSGYRESPPTAPGAAEYCRGIIYFVNGDGRAACKTMWQGAAYMNHAMDSPMLDMQRRHGRETVATLDTYRPICANMGYVWPAYDEAWPY